MPKINQKEYEILKKKQRKGHKYIAREKEGYVIVFTAYHGKSEYRWLVTTNRVGLKYESLFYSSEVFQFIQWTDGAPYEIAELIREYEYTADYYASQFAKLSKVIYGNESEEKEVKKNIEWLKREIHKELESWYGVEGGMDGDGINDIMLLIDQLDEPETLSPKWIEEHKESWKDLSVTGYSVPEKDLQSLLVPKQEITEMNVNDLAYFITQVENEGLVVIEKPVIPQFVADYIEKQKEFGYSFLLAYEVISDSNKRSEADKRLVDYIQENQDDFVRAWYGHTVEQEPKYYVRLPLGAGEVIELYESVGKLNFKDVNVGITGARVTFTEQEIKDYDPRYFAFAKPVEEVEE